MTSATAEQKPPRAHGPKQKIFPFEAAADFEAVLIQWQSNVS